MMAIRKKAPVKKATRVKGEPKPAKPKTPEPAPAPDEKLSQIESAEPDRTGACRCRRGAKSDAGGRAPAAARQRGQEDWEITFSFAASPNATGLTKGEITLTPSLSPREREKG